ncbi:MAG: leucine-rich repeat domain-containing protein [Lentisphaerae bacterium]|nr:leucine-rich repeat domain-containing protein [Lentisphaerota bacterium]
MIVRRNIVMNKNFYSRTLLKSTMIAAVIFSGFLASAENVKADFQKVQDWIKLTYPADSLSVKMYTKKLNEAKKHIETIPDKTKYIRQLFPEAFASAEYELQRAKKQGMIFSDDNRTLVSCPIDLARVVIPRGVTKIKKVMCPYAETVFIPESVRKIERDAFAYCNSLTGIDIPEGVEIIDDSTFKFCEKLKKVTIPESVKYISWEAFENCPLESIYISKNVHGIGTRAFPNAKSVKISKDNKYFAVDEHSALFYVDSHTLIHIPRSFKGGYIVPDGVENIASGAFENCKNLTTVVLPDSVKIIKMSAFANCKNLTAVTLPENLENINAYTFSGCENLQFIRIPSKVKTVESSAFKDCKNLIKVILPGGVEQICKYAFDGCDKLSEIEFHGENTEIFNGVNIPENCKINCKNAKNKTAEKTFFQSFCEFFSI